MRAAPHGWTVTPVHTGHKYKELLGFLALTQKSTVMAQPPLLKPVINNTNNNNDFSGATACQW